MRCFGARSAHRLRRAPYAVSVDLGIVVGRNEGERLWKARVRRGCRCGARDDSACSGDEPDPLSSPWRQAARLPQAASPFRARFKPLRYDNRRAREALDCRPQARFARGSRMSGGAYTRPGADRVAQPGHAGSSDRRPHARGSWRFRGEATAEPAAEAAFRVGATSCCVASAARGAMEERREGLHGPPMIRRFGFAGIAHKYARRK